MNGLDIISKTPFPRPEAIKIKMGSIYLFTKATDFVCL